MAHGSVFEKDKLVAFVAFGSGLWRVVSKFRLYFCQFPWACVNLTASGQGMLRDPARFWLLFVLVYYGLHAALRTALGQPLTEVEAQITEAGWSLALSYDGMMPLYPWLQHAMFRALGPGILAIALLKNLVMVAMAVSVFGLVRMSAGRAWAWLSLLSLMLLPQVAWYSQHALNGDLLAAALATVSVLLLVLLRRHQSAPRYVIFGICLGLGGLSAVSFWWFLAALACAGLSTAPYRAVLWRPVMGAALVPFALIAGVPLVLAGGLFEGFGAGLGSFSAAQNTAHLLQMIVSSAALLLGVVALAMVTGYDKAAPVGEDVRELRQLMARIAVFGVLTVLAATVLGIADALGRQQILPILIFMAPTAALFISPAISERSRLRVTRVAGVVAIAVLMASPIYHRWMMGEVATVQAGAPVVAVDDGAS